MILKSKLQPFSIKVIPLESNMLFTAFSPTFIDHLKDSSWIVVVVRGHHDAVHFFETGSIVDLFHLGKRNWLIWTEKKVTLDAQATFSHLFFHTQNWQKMQRLWLLFLLVTLVLQLFWHPSKVGEKMRRRNSNKRQAKIRRHTEDKPYERVNIGGNNFPIVLRGKNCYLGWENVPIRSTGAMQRPRRDKVCSSTFSHEYKLNEKAFQTTRVGRYLEMTLRTYMKLT